jgi:hypothetical protein
MVESQLAPLIRIRFRGATVLSSILSAAAALGSQSKLNKVIEEA